MEIELKDSGTKVRINKPTGVDQMAYIAELGRLQAATNETATGEWIKYRQSLVVKLAPESFKTIGEVQALTTDDIEQLMEFIEGKLLSLMGKNFLANSPSLAGLKAGTSQS